MCAIFGTMIVDRPVEKDPAFFCETALGKRPVREWIMGLSVDDRRLIGRDIQKVEFGWPLGMPYCRSLGSGLWEVRTDLTNGDAEDARTGPEARAHAYERGALKWTR
jgi:hypothetical protein